MAGKYVNSECVGQEGGPRNRLDEIFRVLNNQTLVDSCIARLHTLAKKIGWNEDKMIFLHASSCVLQMRRETLFKLSLLSRRFIWICPIHWMRVFWIHYSCIEGLFCDSILRNVNEKGTLRNHWMTIPKSWRKPIPRLFFRYHIFRNQKWDFFLDQIFWNWNRYFF